MGREKFILAVAVQEDKEVVLLKGVDIVVYNRRSGATAYSNELDGEIHLGAGDRVVLKHEGDQFTVHLERASSPPENEAHGAKEDA